MFRSPLFIALLLYVLLAAALFPFLKWHVDNPDTFQYLTIAHRYADGSFLNIVNAHWSPLIIWMLVIPIKLFSNGIIAFKCVQLVIGGATLIVWNGLLRPLRSPLRPILLFAAIPFMLSHALLFLTADLLFISFGLVILALSIRGGIFGSRRTAILFGIIGGLWYFSKAFAFPLFIAFLLFLAFIESDRRKWGNVLAALFAFLLTTAPWVIAMSLKYGYPTISEAARFNQTVEVAPMPGEMKLLPLLKDGPHEPPPGAISPWEAPGDVIKLTPLHPWTDPHRYLELVKRNLASIYYYDVQRQLGTPFLIVLFMTILLRGPKHLLRDRILVLPLFLLVALNIGYTAILVQDRYIWINTFLMLFMVGWCLQLLLPDRKFIGGMLTLVICLFAIKRPVKELLFTRDEDVAAGDLIGALMDPIGTLRSSYRIDHDRKQAIEELRPMRLNGALASLRSDDTQRDQYASCLHIAYELGLTYHGEILPDIPKEEQLHQIRDHRIRYFAVWKGMEWDHGTLILDRRSPDLRIFKFDRGLSDR